MDYERFPEELKNFFIILFIIFFLGLILFLENIYIGKIFALFLFLFLFLFFFLDKKAKKEELKETMKLRENRTRYLFKNLPEEFP